MTRGLLVGLTTWGRHDNRVVGTPSMRRSSCCSMPGSAWLCRNWAHAGRHLGGEVRSPGGGDELVITLRVSLCTFYSVERLPGFWAVLAHLNPFFYMNDGFRYGFIGHADGSLAAGIAVMVLANAALWALVHRLFATGYRLKA
jgi:hypothetical protein